MSKNKNNREIGKSHREKIAERQKGENNSNRINWYRPSKVIPLELLEKTIQGSLTKREVKEKLNLTSYELSSIQQYYNFRLPNKNRLIDDFCSNHLTNLERDKALNSLGYQVIRIDLEKENLSRFMKNSDIRKCLKKYLLNQ